MPLVEALDENGDGVLQNEEPWKTARLSIGCWEVWFLAHERTLTPIFLLCRIVY